MQLLLLLVNISVMIVSSTVRCSPVRGRNNRSAARIHGTLPSRRCLVDGEVGSSGGHGGNVIADAPFDVAIAHSSDVLSLAVVAVFEP